MAFNEDGADCPGVPVSNSHICLRSCVSLFPSFLLARAELQRWRLYGNQEWVGFDNYRRIFFDSVFWLSLKNAAIYAVFFVPLSIIIALAVAILLNQKIRG